MKLDIENLTFRRFEKRLKEVGVNKGDFCAFIGRGRTVFSVTWKKKKFMPKYMIIALLYLELLQRVEYLEGLIKPTKNGEKRNARNSIHEPGRVAITPPQ